MQNTPGPSGRLRDSVFQILTLMPLHPTMHMHDTLLTSSRDTALTSLGKQRVAFYSIRVIQECVSSSPVSVEISIKHSVVSLWDMGLISSSSILLCKKRMFASNRLCSGTVVV